MHMLMWGDISFGMHCFHIVFSLRNGGNLGGALNQAAVVRAAFNFNYPLRVGRVKGRSAERKLQEAMKSISFSGSDNVILETIKRGEDDSDVTSSPIHRRGKNVVFRIYEAYGGKGSGKITTYVRKGRGLIVGRFR
jgi:alpha-mannosidase